jgi:uncharacterized protein (DUF58 family)
MHPRLRLVAWIAIGSPLWLLGLMAPAGWLAGAGYLALLFAVSVRDYRGLPAAASLEVEREIPRLSLDAPAEFRVRLRNGSPRALVIAIRDELPSALTQTTPMEEIEVPANGTCLWRYTVRPLRRGRYVLPDLVARVGRPRGLVEREIRLPAGREVPVYPRFAVSSDYRLLARISRQDESARRPRRTRGQGTDYESLRQYQRGEDLRTVDWKVSARRGYLVSRNLQTERGQQVSILIDGGRLMAEKIGDHARFEHALHAAVMLSYVAWKRGDTLALATFSDQVDAFVPPSRGAAIMPRVLESLSTVEARPVESDYWYVVGHVMDRIRRRSLLVMLTDVLDPGGSSGLIANMITASRRHLVLLVVMREPRIAEIAESDPEDVSGVWARAAASHVALERHLALETMRSRGILVLETTPDQLSIQLIRRYLEVRKGNLQ